MLFQLLYRIICPRAFERSMHTLSGHNRTILKFAAEFSPIIQRARRENGYTYVREYLLTRKYPGLELCCEEVPYI